eukprot:SAG31_NODE_3727_length_3946_cov_2.007798_4_plen_141_part_00
MESVCGLDEAGVAGSSTCQVYTVLLNCFTVAGTTALAAELLLVSVRLRAAPEEVQPHTFACCGACWRTMCELNMRANEALGSAIDEDEADDGDSSSAAVLMSAAAPRRGRRHTYASGGRPPPAGRYPHDARSTHEIFAVG